MSKEKFLEESADTIVEELVIKDPEWINVEYTCYKVLLDKSLELIRKRSNIRGPDDSFH